MSIASTTRLEQLEYRFELARIAYAEALARIASLESQLANLQMGQFIGSSGTAGTTVWEIPGGLAISAGSSSTADVYKLVSGSSTLAATSATIYNTYGAATTSGKALTVGSNGDGTFTVIGQSC